MKTKIFFATFSCSLALGGTMFASSPLCVAAPTKPAAKSVLYTLHGHIGWLVRIGLPTNAKVHLALYTAIPGVPELPIVATTMPANQGNINFSLPVPGHSVGANPTYRLRAWVVANGRVLMISRTPTTYIKNLNEPVNIIMRMAGNMEPQPVPLPHPVSDKTYKLSGQIVKLDRRALLPDAKVIVQLRDVSLADAPSKLIGETEIELKGHQLPVEYNLTLVGFDLPVNHRYAVSARVIEAGRTSYQTTSSYAFDPTKKDQKVDVRVVTAG